jgi:hypothetical protein
MITDIFRQPSRPRSTGHMPHNDHLAKKILAKYEHYQDHEETRRSSQTDDLLIPPF